MAQQSDFLESMKKKYLERTNQLRQQELDMRIRIENMEKIINEVKSKPYCICPSADPKPCGPPMSQTPPTGRPTVSCPSTPPPPSFCKTCTCTVKDSAARATAAAAEIKRSRPNSTGGCCCNPEEMELSTGLSSDSCICSDGDTNASKESGKFSMCPEVCNSFFRQFIAMLPSGKACPEKKPCEMDEVPVKDDSGSGCSNESSEIVCLCQQCSGAESSASLKTDDLENIKILNELFEEQKHICNQIDGLAQKEKQYECIFKSYKSMSPQECLCSFAESFSPKPADLTRENADLKTQNLLLQGELRDMKLEIRQYLERVDSPAQLQLRNERLKNQHLEEQLENLQKELLSTHQCYTKEINTMKMQLCCVSCELYDVKQAHEKLRDELDVACKRCTQLEDDLIRQKLSEAETIRHLSASANVNGTSSKTSTELGVNSVEVCDENLGAITRKLSTAIKTTNENDPLSKDAAEMAKHVKQLTELVDQSLNVGGKDAAPSTSAATESKGTEKDTKSVLPTINEENVDEVDAQPASEEYVKELRKKFCPCIQMLNTFMQDKCAKAKAGAPDPTSEADDKDTGKKDCKCSKARTAADKSAEESDQEKSTADADDKYKKKGCKCGQVKSASEEKPPSEPVPTEADDETKKKICKCDNAGSDDDNGNAADEASNTTEQLCSQVGSQLSSCCPFSKALVPVQTDALEVIEDATMDRVQVKQRVDTTNPDDIKQMTAVRGPKGMPVTVDTQVDIVEEIPTGLHITTTITKSGTLEVITEGPEGVVESMLTYTEAGDIQVVTEVYGIGDFGGAHKMALATKVESVNDQIEIEEICECEPCEGGEETIPEAEPEEIVEEELVAAIEEEEFMTETELNEEEDEVVEEQAEEEFVDVMEEVEEDGMGDFDPNADVPSTSSSVPKKKSSSVSTLERIVIGAPPKRRP